MALTLDQAIPPGQRVLIDTSVALAYLTGTESTSPAATRLFDDFLASGRDVGVMSMITVGEILVRPFRAGPAAVAVAEAFLQQFAELDLVEMDYAIAREAARIRASTDLRMPDALILSSATTALRPPLHERPVARSGRDEAGCRGVPALGGRRRLGTAGPRVRPSPAP